ncbi:MAG: molybdenum cofactor guanylyltransferase [Chthoniobacterales bacterium]
MRCSAVLLAGGKSSRMGSDKAFLEFDGKPLWRRQIETLRRLGPEQLMISGPRRTEWNAYEIVADDVVDAGPLAGVAAALQKCSKPLLAVLAVDLPWMTADFLRSVLALCGDGRGAVPRSAHGFEPLAALYPANCASQAAAALRSGDFSMQNFIRRAIEQGLLVEREISEEETLLFTNLNTPADL